jgi:acetyltransferase-like isoleucine patch superfamily enzyme
MAPGAVLAGEVVVGDYASVGTNATVMPRIKIGSDAVIGAGAVVTRDVPDRAVVVGNPARILRIREVRSEEGSHGA